MYIYPLIVQYDQGRIPLFRSDQEHSTEPGQAGAFVIGTGETIAFNQVRYLLDAGIAVLSVEHRLLPQWVSEPHMRCRST